MKAIHCRGARGCGGPVATGVLHSPLTVTPVT